MKKGGEKGVHMWVFYFFFYCYLQWHWIPDIEQRNLWLWKKLWKLNWIASWFFPTHSIYCLEQAQRKPSHGINLIVSTLSPKIPLSSDS